MDATWRRDPSVRLVSTSTATVCNMSGFQNWMTRQKMLAVHGGATYDVWKISVTKFLKHFLWKCSMHLECFRKTWFSNTSRSNANLDFLHCTIEKWQQRNQNLKALEATNIQWISCVWKSYSSKWSEVTSWCGVVSTEHWGCKRYNLMSHPFWPSGHI